MIFYYYWGIKKHVALFSHILEHFLFNIFHTSQQLLYVLWQGEVDLRIFRVETPWPAAWPLQLSTQPHGSSWLNREPVCQWLVHVDPRAHCTYCYYRGPIDNNFEM